MLICVLEIRNRNEFFSHKYNNICEIQIDLLEIFSLTKKNGFRLMREFTTEKENEIRV